MLGLRLLKADLPKILKVTKCQIGGPLYIVVTVHVLFKLFNMQVKPNVLLQIL